MKIFKNGQELLPIQESPKEIEFSFCFYTSDGLKKIWIREVVGISEYININNGARFKKFELIGNYIHEGIVYDLIKATYTLRGEESNIMFLGKFNDGVINIKDHNIEIVGTKKDFETKNLKPISFLYSSQPMKIEEIKDFLLESKYRNILLNDVSIILPHDNHPGYYSDKIKEIHCHGKVFFRNQILDLIIIKWANGAYSPETDTSVYYGHFNDGVL